MTVQITVPVALLLLSFNVTLINPSIHNIIYNEFYPEKSNFGNFVSPNFPEKYPQDVRYFYIFVGSENHQVQLQFHHFNIEGLSHNCDKDYLDIYIEIKTVSGKINITEDLFGQSLLGRYCGHTLQFIPNTVVSKHNAIVLDFFSDKNTQQSYNQDDHMGQLGFKGSYQFRLNEFNLKFMATTAQYSCYYLIHNNESQMGYIQSPNYPGLMPGPLDCIYEFRSNDANQRLELEFIEFNLYQQDQMCPVEYVEIIDDAIYNKNSQSIAGRLCGEKNSSRFVLSHSRSYLRLVVLAGRDYMKEPRNIDLYKGSLQNSGFRIKFVFSENLVSIKKLSNNRNRIPGSECDIHIQSSGQSHGVLVSPGMDSLEIKRTRICNYYFFGIHNSQNMETVQLDFSYLFIPKIETENCTIGSLTMYSTKFKLKDLVKRRRSVTIEDDPDKILCGSLKVPYSVTSRNPVFILKLNLTKMKSKRPAGFKLSYQFLKDFGIPGYMVSRGECHYRYESQLNGDHGFINSPFYSSFYPNNSSCRYDLLANNDETIRIVFQVFQTAEEVSAKLSSSHEVHLSCHQDYLSVSEIIKTKSGVLRTDRTERYCGTSVPGLLVSQKASVGFTLVFQSDIAKNGPGFLAKYEFIKKQRIFTNRCGENVTTESQSGIISSPNFPQRYSSDLICEWHLHSQKSSRAFLLLFTSFQIEGTAKSCSNAVVRIYEGNHVNPQLELCGTDSAIPAYASSGSFVRVRFLTDISAKGAKGFQLIWTQIIPSIASGSCTEFQCVHSRHCISRSLTCNKIINCGSFISADGSTSIDDSDEINACPVKMNHTSLYTGLAVVAIILGILTSLVLYYIYKNKALLKMRLKLQVSCSEPFDQITSSPSHSLMKERPTSSISGSLSKVQSKDIDHSAVGSLLTNDSTSHNHRQSSFDLGNGSLKQKRNNNVDAISDEGTFYQEKMQKISIV